jgi:hypothetical protein
MLNLCLFLSHTCKMEFFLFPNLRCSLCFGLELGGKRGLFRGTIFAIINYVLHLCLLPSIT